MVNEKFKTVDDVIHYFVQSKKEMREDAMRRYQTPEFQKAIAELRALKKK